MHGRRGHGQDAAVVANHEGVVVHVAAECPNRDVVIVLVDARNDVDEGRMLLRMKWKWLKEQSIVAMWTPSKSDVELGVSCSILCAFGMTWRDR